MTEQQIDDICKEVKDVLLRHSTDGEDSFPLIAKFWDTTQSHAALAMALLKIARIEYDVSIKDSYIDAIGYLMLSYDKKMHNL